MSGLQLTPLREAIAKQIRNYVQRDAHVAPYSVATDDSPVIEILFPDGTYVHQTLTFGPAGMSDVYLDIRLICKGSRDDSQRAFDDFVSSGTGSGSSIAEALAEDKTFGGLAQTVRGVNDVGIEVVDVVVTDFETTGHWPIIVTVKKVGASV